MMKKIYVLLGLVAFAVLAQAQVIVVDPPFPTADEPVTVYLNTTGTGLENYDGDIYAHTGITVNGQQWQHVVGDWGDNDTQPRMTHEEDNIYSLEISPSIREFYQAGASDDITQMCFVFRSADGNQQTSPDIFYDVNEPALDVVITLPEINPLIVQPGDIIHVAWNTNMADSSFLFVGEERVFAGTGVSFTYDISVTGFGKKYVTAMAVSGNDTVTDSFYFYSRGEVIVEPLPEGIKDGINYINNSTVILCLYAPEKEYVFAWGDYSNWELSDEVYMKKTPDGNRYWVEISGLTPGQPYIFQYFIDGEIRVGDMYADQVSDPWNDHWISSSTYPNLPDYPYEKTTGIATVLQTAQEPYEWQTDDFTPPDKTDLVVYELLVRDFTAAHDFQTTIDTLDYLERLGVNAIELMPVSEFEGNSSWGYNPNYYFAPDKYYGPKNTLKAFIDECHSRGIAVILDMVLNHAYGTCPFVLMYWDAENNRPAENNPWFNVTSPNPDYAWGYDFNHESPETKEFVDRVNRYWMSEYRFDGFRFDFTKGFTNTPGNGWAYDQARINILERMADSIWAFKPDAYVILEHFADNSEEKVLANHGMMLWGNSNYNYNEATMGYNNNGGSDFSWISYKNRNWNDPHVMGYMESHDEERLMYKNITYGNSNGSYDVRDTAIALQRQALAANFFFTVPGPKMIWQFGERGYDYTIDYNGRVGEKPPRWDYMDNWMRRRLYFTYASLIDLKKTEDAFRTADYDLDLYYAMKKVRLNGPDMSVVILGNFDVRTGEIDPDFYTTGTWYEYWTGDSIEVTNVHAHIELEPGEYRLYTDKKLNKPEYVGVDEWALQDKSLKIRLFPNPATSEINLTIEEGSGEMSGLTLLDITGKRIKELSDIKLQEGINTYRIGLDNLQPGLYLIKIEIGQRSVVKKIVVQ